MSIGLENFKKSYYTAAVGQNQSRDIADATAGSRHSVADKQKMSVILYIVYVLT